MLKSSRFPTRISRSGPVASGPVASGLVASGLAAVLVGVGILVAGPAQASARQLEARARAMAGQPVGMDPRLQVPDCPAEILLEWAAPVHDRLVARCVQTGWRLSIPLFANPSMGDEGMGLARRPAPVIRRGDVVRVARAGAGYRIEMEAVALGDARPGERIMLRNPLSGVRIAALAGPDGTVLLAGQAVQGQHR